MKVVAKNIKLRTTNFVLNVVLAYLVIWSVTFFVPVIWQLFDYETGTRIRTFFEENSAAVLINSLILAVGYAIAVEIIETIKWKRIKELEKTNPELAKEKASHELAKTMMPLLKEAKRNRQKAERREEMHQMLPKPIRDIQEAKDNLLNSPVPKHREKAVLIVAGIVFVVFVIVVLIVTYH